MLRFVVGGDLPTHWLASCTFRLLSTTTVQAAEAQAASVAAADALAGEVAGLKAASDAAAAASTQGILTTFSL